MSALSRGGVPPSSHPTARGIRGRCPADFNPNDRDQLPPVRPRAAAARALLLRPAHREGIAHLLSTLPATILGFVTQCSRCHDLAERPIRATEGIACSVVSEGWPHGAVGKQVRDIVPKPGLSSSEGDHRRVLPMLTYLHSRIWNGPAHQPVYGGHTPKDGHRTTPPSAQRSIGCG
jgi:hypothetical protein